MEGAVVRRRVVVSGLVQGVWFRDTCQQVAGEHGVGGWVRNRPDLTVEAAFEGPPAAVEAMVQWCHVGPPRARVSGVEVAEEEPQGEVTFRVLW
jgi:acylphosphatase